jgi:P4 family phage/plasmid primase-like protien
MCYDFNLRSSRQITKEDYQTQTTGYPWKEKDEHSIQLIKEFVNGLHDNEEMTESLLSCLSCALYGENINEKFFVWTGNGRNGKGTIETIFKNVLGNYYHALNPSQLTSFQKEADKPQPELAKLRFTRGIVSSEPEESETFKISVIKKWTGRDPLTARTLNKEPFTFNPQFTPYILCNTIPVLSDMDGGIAERLRVIPFNFSFTGEEGKPLAENQKMADIKIKEKIRDDKYKYGLLHLLIETWHKYEGKFYECEAIKKATLQYFEEQNTLKAWFFENYKIDEIGRTSANDVFLHYQKINKFIGHKKFGSELKKICPSVRVSTGIKYKCVRLCEWEDDKECLIDEKEKEL